MMTRTTINQASLFDPVDAMQQQAHAPFPAPVLPGNAEPPVTPEPTPEERRDQGIRAAVEHADAEQSSPKWSDQAEAYAEMMIAKRGYKPFLMEEIVQAAIRDGIPEPPDRRAWGHVIRALAKRGVVRKMGFAEAATSNCSPKVLWSKAVPAREEQHAHD
jgi:hypothetical protein